MITIKVSYRAVYNRRKQLDRHGKASVLIEAYQNGKRRYIKTGLNITPQEWDEPAKEVKKRPDLNRLIRNKIEELERFELTFSAKYNRAFQLLDFDLLKDAENEQPKELITFTAFSLEQIGRDHAKGEINLTTMKRYKRVVRLLAESIGKKEVAFTDITYTAVEGFGHYLITVKRQVHNTAYKHHQVVDKYLTEAVKKGIFDLKNNPYNDFKKKQSRVETVVLHPTEIDKIERLTFSSANQHLEIYRDAFLLAYYTLLRIGDITNLKRSNIIETNEGLELDMSAQKTKKINRQKIFAMHPTANGFSKPEQIIRKYWRTDKSAFFNRSHPNMNEYIKTVVRLAGINKPITFHTSRHSGITYLVTIMPVPIVQKLAQHKSIVTTMRYVHIAQQDVYQAISQANWNQNGKST